MMRMLAAGLCGLTVGLALAGFTLPVQAQETSPGMTQSGATEGSGRPAGLLPGSYAPIPTATPAASEQSQDQPPRGSEAPTVPGGDHTAAVPATAETASMSGSNPGNGMVLGGSDASAALPEMQVPTRPGEGKGTLQ